VSKWLAKLKKAANGVMKAGCLLLLLFCIVDLCKKAFTEATIVEEAYSSKMSSYCRNILDCPLPVGREGCPSIT